jgi:hypothetical protein
MRRRVPPAVGSCFRLPHGAPGHVAATISQLSLILLTTTP